MKKLILTMALALLLTAVTSLAQSIQPIYSFPQGPLVLFASLVQGADGNFYGTTGSGGDYSVGTVFKVSTNGILTALATFADTNGAFPYASLTFGPDGTLSVSHFGFGAPPGPGQVVRVDVF